MRIMVIRFFSFLFFVLLLAACGVPEDRFRLEGRFKNINQGEFFLYNLDKGTLDTLAIRDGRFVYDIGLTDTTTMVLMFPNYSELPVIAIPGTVVTVKGDVSHLKETEVLGTADNDALTAFRLSTADKMPPAVKEEAARFIADHPEMVASVHLLHRYYIQDIETDYPKAYELCCKLLESQPTNIALVQLHQRLELLKNYHPKGPLPQFNAIDTKGRTVSNASLTGRVNVILAWASWSFDSQNTVRQLNMVRKEHPNDLCIVSVCLDASPVEGRLMLEHDSINWPNVCDGKMWDSPIMAQLGLTFVPDNIVTDKYGNIMARSLKTPELRSKVEQMLEK